MTTRMRGWQPPPMETVQEEKEKDVESAYDYAESGATRPGLNADIIDEAVQSVFDKIPVSSGMQSVLRDLLATDTTSGVAHAYYHGVASKAMQLGHARANRKPLTVSYALDDVQAANLQRYAPEFDLKFVHRDVHDHPVAAAMRIVDRALVRSRVPPGVPYDDIGGAVMPHIKDGLLGVQVHVCAPDADRKDGARRTLQNLEAKKIARDLGCTVQQRAAAAAYLQGDVAAVCGKSAQECNHSARVATAVHVYDIPLADWPYIMTKRGMSVVEGCMLFSQKVFGERYGEFETAGARYEIDEGRNVFRMGFVDSPAWWYEHDLDEYLAYGVDQVLQSKVGTYSYKIIERRGDTVFFRILRVGGDVFSAPRASYRMPGVPVVEVLGFDPKARANKGFSGMTRVKYVWPAPLWDSMVSHATLLAERGQLTHEVMYNRYRTVAPRQTINSTLVFGGHTVTLDELLPLIVNSSLAGLAECARARAETGAMTDAAIKRRARLSEIALAKVAKGFLDAAQVLAGVVLYPFVWLSRLIDDAARSMAAYHVVEWAPVASVREVEYSRLASVCTAGRSPVGVDDEDDADRDFTSAFAAAAEVDPLVTAMDDPELAARVLATVGELPKEFVEKLQSVAKATPPPSYRTEPTSEGSVSEAVPEARERDEAGVEQRRAAVEEAILECENEQKHIEAACRMAASELMVGGRPSETALHKRKEEHRNPEFWWIECGIVARSYTGAAATDFDKAAVFLMRPCRVTEASVCPVYVEKHQAVGADGAGESQEYSRISDDSYTGWALTTDYLMIYNGPEIVATMRRALAVGDFSFKVSLEQGPPGCGKTTSVVKTMVPGDFVMSPARASCKDTQRKIVEVKGNEGAALAGCVRTLDSYLVNYGLVKKLRMQKATRLLADECFMSRFGKWCAAASLLGVGEVIGFGDKMQIPHVPRVGAPKLHLLFRPTEERTNWKTWRCPATAVACWGAQYDWRVRSGSKESGKVSSVTSSSGLQIPEGCVMMGMYQADKKAIRQLYAGKGAKFEVMTVHESQGKTFKHVWLHRFDARRRTDKLSLYDREEYVLVAMSRHTHSFVYVSPPVGDLVSAWIDRGKSARRVAAAADVASAGESKEFG